MIGNLREVPETTLVDWVKKNGERGKKAFAQLVEDYQSSVGRILSSLVSRSLAKDASQEAFMVAYTSIANLRDDSKFGSWLRSIAVRTAYRMERKSTRLNEVDLDKFDLKTGQNHGQQLEHKDAVLKCLAQLSFIYREALVLRYIEELSYEEIASTLDISISAAKMRAKRARGEFKTVWQTEET